MSLPSDVDLPPLLRLACSRLEARARERQIELRVEAPSTCGVRGNSESIDHALSNLLSSAFDLTPDGGRIRCLLLVSTSAELIVASDDTALFRVRLPRSGATETRPSQQPQAPGRAASEPPALASSFGEHEVQSRVFARADAADKPLILVVEDQPGMSQAIAEALSKEYRVLAARTGTEGLSQAEQWKPDLIVSDTNVPGLNGEQLLREVRKDEALAAVPFVLLTDEANEEVRHRMLRGGAQDYLTKPIAAEELRARIGNLVRSKRARDILQRELDLQLKDLEELAFEAVERKRQLEDAVTSLRFAREQADNASQLKSNLLGMVSHELRTPVTIFQLQLQRLRRTLGSSASDQQRQLLDRMAATTKRLAQLVDSLLQYARVQSGRLTANVEPFNLSDLAKEVIDEARAQAEDKGLSLELHAPADLPPLHSDPHLVRLVLVNLVGNALKFTERGHIDLCIEHDPSGHRVVVKDTGPGIALDERTRIFEPFEHIEPTRHKHTPGVGLGLALVREMATALGGHIDLASEPGQGSEFTVFLPCSAA